MAELAYRGRVITGEDILYIRELIAAHPHETRRRLSQTICEAWQWKQPNGALRDMVCRGMLLMLDRGGQIELPPVKFVPHNPLARRVRPTPVLIDRTPITSALKELQPIELQQVRRTGDEPLFNSLMEQHHYLKYEQPVGEQLKYVAWAQGRPIACLAWSSAPRHLGSRDRYIGWKRNTEKARAVLSQDSGATGKPETSESVPAGHGRNPAAAFKGANRVAIAHTRLHSGDQCPECLRGKVYRQKEPATLVRFVGHAPLEATVFEMERLRCNACGEVYTADEPETAGPAKYDETALAMIALLKYGTGAPFNRLERLQGQLGIPLPATTQWELMEAAAKSLRSALEELIRQAAQGSVMHNDDTGMRILRLAREPGDKRTGTFTSGIVSLVGAWTVALFFTGWKHAGENIAEVLKQRARELPAPIQMCDALSRNTPKGVETLIANCLAHGRRQVVEVVDDFPEECRYVLETLGGVYRNDALSREQELLPEDRLRFHQEHSRPLMKGLHQWMEAQLAEHKTEPNSRLGKAISYLLNHWQKLTVFLRVPGSPIDNNIVERSLKKAILNRRNALFYKTLNGAGVGDLFMSLIHTCELNGANPFDYLTELLRHAEGMKQSPSEWMPWNYRDTLARLARPAAA